MSEFTEALGKMLQNLRLAHDLTQEEVARLLNISRSAYSYYESGRITPDLRKIRILTELYLVPPEFFLYPERYTPIHFPNRRATYHPRKKSLPPK